MDDLTYWTLAAIITVLFGAAVAGLIRWSFHHSTKNTAPWN